MSLVYEYLLPILWLSWAAYWWISARNVKTTTRREPLWARLFDGSLLALAGLLFWIHLPFHVLRERFLPLSAWTFWVGVALTAGGLLFAVWARRHLGRNWSGTVTLKEDHELITSGPYTWVRHPIYTGLLLAFLGSAVALGEWRGILSVALAFWAFWRRIRFEERWMREQFGSAYLAYSERVRALVPFVL